MVHVISHRSVIHQALIAWTVAAALGLAAATAGAQTQPNAIMAINESAARSEISVTPLRGGLSVLMGSGGNIIVLAGKEGKLMVDAGIAVSQARVEAAIDKLPGLNARR